MYTLLDSVEYTLLDSVEYTLLDSVEYTLLDSVEYTLLDSVEYTLLDSVYKTRKSLTLMIRLMVNLTWHSINIGFLVITSAESLINIPSKFNFYL